MRQVSNNWRAGEFICALIRLSTGKNFWLDSESGCKLRFMQNEVPHFSESFPWF